MIKFRLPFVAVLLLAAITIGGCGDINFPQVENKIDDAKGAIPVVADAADKATEAVEEVTGKTVLSEGAAKKVADTSETVGKAANVGRSLARVAEGVAPEKAKPYISLAEAALGLLSVVAGASAAFARKREKSKAKALLTTVKLLEDADGVSGKDIVKAAKKDGTSKELEASYLEMVKSG